MNLARFPRIRLGHLPTPLEPLQRLSAHLGGPNIWIKRDDCTGLSTGGNKTRKLEYLFADALAKGADTVITAGATQSNHARQTAAAAAKLGLRCVLVLEDRTGRRDEAYTQSGNVLLDHLHGASIEYVPGGTDMMVAMQGVAELVHSEGGKPYIIPGGGSNAIGSLGYVNAALELVAQATGMGLRIDHVIHATGSAGTQSGLVTGLVALNSGIPVLGIGVSKRQAEMERAVFDLCQDSAAHLGLPGIVKREHVVADCGYIGQGYGIATEGMVEAVRLMAELEGILLDPVYSGKAMAGLIDHVRQGRFAPGSNIVFLHTGGTVGLFAYPEALAVS